MEADLTSAIIILKDKKLLFNDNKINNKILIVTKF